MVAVVVLVVVEPGFQQMEMAVVVANPAVVVHRAASLAGSFVSVSYTHLTLPTILLV